MHWPRNLLSWFALLHDVIMAAASYMLAHWLRLDGALMGISGHYFWPGLTVFSVIALLTFVTAGLYRGLWRYASMQDLITLTKAVTLSLVLFYFGLALATQLQGVPRSVPFIQWLLLMMLMGGPRFCYRMIKDKRHGVDLTLAFAPKVPVLLIGATDAAELFIRESHRNPRAPYRVVGLTEDDNRKRGQQVHGVRIYGRSDHLEKIVAKLERKGRKPQRVVLAEPQLAGAQVEKLLAQCETMGLVLSRIPPTLELQSGRLDRLEIKPIAVEDLLRRSQHVHDRDAMREFVAGKTVLITGAGGTIGGELTRQIAASSPKRLVLYEHSEFNLYKIEREIRDAGLPVPVEALLGDIRDAAHLDSVFAMHRPQLVFHAAALKHVPLAEENPVETILTNVGGTREVALAAVKHHVEAVVLISTDKAVRPTNVMGATKRLAEQFCQAIGRASDAPHDTRFFAVRFGNVLGSTGSVVPRFQEQLAAGGPLTVTHAEMTRYFMTVREAVELVIQAAVQGCATRDGNGGLFVLDMGTPVKIDELARQMIRLSGQSLETIGITYTGLRPGEKMHEELFYDDEALDATDHAAIRRARQSGLTTLASLEKELKPLLAACRKRDSDHARSLLHKLVPEFQAVTP